MMWWPKPTGIIARATSIEPKRLMLWTAPNHTRVLLISTDEHNDDDNPQYFNLFVSSEERLSGLIYKSAFTEWVWDISELAQVEPDLDNWTMTDAPCPQGTLACDGNGEHFIAYSSQHHLPRRAWLSLKTFKRGSPSHAAVLFPKWRVVTRRPDAQTLFQWPTDLNDNESGGE